MPKNVVDAIVSVETFIISIPREVPYLGPLKEGEAINERGYLIRKGNRTIYPSTDMTLLIKVTGANVTVSSRRRRPKRSSTTCSAR